MTTPTATLASSIYNYSSHDNIPCTASVQQPLRVARPITSRNPSHNSVLGDSGDFVVENAKAVQLFSAKRSTRPTSILSFCTSHTTDSGTASLKHRDRW